jgi:voltage-dependent calcium channel
MSSSDQYDPRNPSTPPQSIPLRDLPRPPDSSYSGQGEWGKERGQSLLAPESNIASSSSYRTRFERLEDVPLSPAEKILPNDDMAPIPQIQGPVDDELGSPIEPATFQTAIGFAGLSIPRLSISQPAASRAPSGTEDPESPSHESQRYIESNDAYFQPVDSDRVPLTDPNFLQPLSGAHTTSRSGQSHHRPGFRSVDFGDSNSRNRGSRLGDDLPGLEAGYGRSRSRSFGDNLSPTGRQGSVSPSASESPLSRAGSIMRAMSQRIVNLSNEPEPTEQFFRRASSTIEVPAEGIPPIHVMSEDTEYRPPRRTIPAEKKSSIVSEDFTFVNSPPLLPKTTNPFKGKSLGIFSPTNPVRMWFCDILVNPITEIVILILIVLQTVLLAVQSSSGESDGDIYTEALNQSLRWGNSFFDYAILALFVIFTLEIAIRIIVSGFFFNAAEYSTIDRTKGFWAAMTIRYNTFFGPRRQASIRNQRDPSVDVFSNSLARSFTAVQGNSLPASVEELQRQQLARRAFLRHSLNRIDFIAVVSFWISFLLAITGIEASTHLHLFRMLSCLRILRLLYLTNGTSVSLEVVLVYLLLITRLDYSKELEEGCPVACQCIIFNRILLAPFCYHWSPGLQV